MKTRVRIHFKTRNQGLKTSEKQCQQFHELKVQECGERNTKTYRRNMQPTFVNFEGINEHFQLHPATAC